MSIQTIVQLAEAVNASLQQSHESIMSLERSEVPVLPSFQFPDINERPLFRDYDLEELV